MTGSGRRGRQRRPTGVVRRATPVHAGASPRPRPEPFPPPLWLFALEGRAVFEWGAWWLSRPWFSHAPKGASHPVLVLPGMLAGDGSTWPLRRFLQELGYAALPWGLGVNRGPRPGLTERLLERLQQVAEGHGQRVSLVGWSLGGLMARALAWKRPDLVRTVITLGAPLSADPQQTRVGGVFRLISGVDPQDPDIRALLGGTPQVPLTSILTRLDGVVHWRASLAPQADRCESVELPASHLGLGVNPLALYVIADRLAQDPESWRPFEIRGWRRLLFRDPGRGEDGAAG